MAYALRSFSKEIPFSAAVRKAWELGYSENDVREDLSGLDSARKVVILARQIGLKVELEDVQVGSLVPEHLMNKDYNGDYTELLDDIQEIDATMQNLYEEAEAEGKALRYKFVIDAATSQCRCGLEAVPSTDPLFRLRDDENLVAFETLRYRTSPLIVKGAAAGPDLAASGIFTDLLRLTRAYSSLQD